MGRVDCRVIAAAAAIVAGVLGSSKAFATNAVYGGTTGGNWTTLGWSPSVPNAVGDKATLSSSPPSIVTVTLDRPVTLGGLALDTGTDSSSKGWTIAGTNALTLDNPNGPATVTLSTGNNSITAPVILADDATFTSSVSGRTFRFDSVASAPGAARNLSLTGVGNISLNVTGALGNLTSSGAGSRTLVVNSGTTGTVGSLGFAGYKLGGGTLSFTGSGSTGGLAAQGGMVSADSAGAGPAWVAAAPVGSDAAGGHVSSAYRATVSGAGAKSAYAAASGTIYAANIAPEAIRVLPGGAVVYASAAELPAANANVPAAGRGANIAAGYAVDQAFVNRMASGFEGSIGIGADSSNNLDLTGQPAAKLSGWKADASWVNVGSVNYSGTITPQGDYRFGNGNTELVVSSALTGTRGVDVRSDGTGAMLRGGVNATSVEALANRLTLTGSNNFTGALSVGAYNVVRVSAAGNLSGASEVRLEGGQLFLDGTNGSMVNDAVAVNVNKGSVLRVESNGGTENLGTLNLNRGLLWVVGGGSGATKFSDIARSKGGTVDVNAADIRVAGSGTISGKLGPGNTLGGWATAGNGADFAVWESSSERVVALTSYHTGAASTWDASKNAATGGDSIAASRTVNNVKFTGTSPTLTISSGQTLTVGSGGVIGTSGNTTIAGPGKLTAGNGSGGQYELFFNSTSAGSVAAISVSAVIADNGTNPVAVVRNSNTTGDGDTDLRLTAANTYSGGTYLNQGKISFNNASSFGTGDIHVVGFGGTDVNNWKRFGRRATLNNMSSTTVAIANNLNVYADVALTSNTVVATTYSGQVKLFDGASVMIATSGATTLSGKVTGNGDLLAQGSGLTQIGGGMGDTAANDFVGKLYVLNTGTSNVTLSKAAGTDAVSAGGMVIGGFQTLGDKNVVLGNWNLVNDAATVEFVGGTGCQGVLRMNGMRETVSGLVGLADSGVVTNLNASGAAPSADALLTLSGDGRYEFGGTIKDGSTRKLSLVKTGSGTQILSGANTFTGTTTITGGKLVVNGSLASPVELNGGAIGGSGRITGAIGITGPAMFAPGNSAGTLTLSGALPLAADSVLAFELNGEDRSVGGGVNDLIAGVTDLTLDGRLDLSALTGFETVHVGDRWTLVTYSGVLTDHGLEFGAGLDGYRFALDTNTPGQVDVVAIAVPEPGVVMMGAGVCLAALGIRRRAAWEKSDWRMQNMREAYPLGGE